MKPIARMSLRAMLVLACTHGAIAFAANLVPNPDFDSDTNHWTLLGAAGSNGSLELSMAAWLFHAPPAARIVGDPFNGATVASDCMPVTDTGGYDLATVVVSEHGGEFDHGSIRASAFSDDACADGALIEVAASVPLSSAGATQGFTGRRVNFLLPSGTHAVRVDLHVDPSNASGFAPAMQFDDVRFGPTGTAPVTLQSFDVD